MPRCETTQFGTLDYDETAEVWFPAGLPAFEQETRFLLIERTETAPVVFLQSLITPRLLFLAVPARMVDAAFEVSLLPEEREALGLAPDGALVDGNDFVALALLTVREAEQMATVNLLAPVVIAARTRRALQIIQSESGYSVEQPLVGTGGRACS